jgi:hypothetical protein
MRVLGLDNDLGVHSDVKHSSRDSKLAPCDGRASCETVQAGYPTVVLRKTAGGLWLTESYRSLSRQVKRP